MPAPDNRYTVTPAARADLDDIWRYTAETWSPDQAERYTNDLIDAFEALAKEPDRGRVLHQQPAGYRYWSSGRHFIFYRMRDGHPEIVRLLHKQRDFVRHLPKSD